MSRALWRRLHHGGTGGTSPRQSIGSPTVVHGGAVAPGIAVLRTGRSGLTIPGPTKVMGAAAVGTAAAFLAVELRRIWKLGSMPTHSDDAQAKGVVRRIQRTLRIAREGYAVSRVRRNAVFNMLVSFVVTLGTVRAITTVIRTRGGLGPIRNVQYGNRHVHHFVPGMLVCFASGSYAIGSQSERLRPWLAIPFGAGAALVLDETALLLQLEDVYWSEEGVMSLQVAFAGIALLAAVGYGIQFLRAGTTRVLEQDWQAAARAWDDLADFQGIRA